MPENTDTQTRRILLALDARGCHPASLQRVLTLAGRISAQIHSLYIEDTDLLQLARLPFTREVSLDTAQPRRLSADTISRMLRNSARQLELMIQEQAKHAAVLATFETIRGQRIPVILQASTRANLIIIPESLSSGPFSTFQETHNHRAIAAMYDQIDKHQSVLDIAGFLAKREQATLIVFCATEQARLAADQQLAAMHIDYQIRNYRNNTDITDYLTRVKPRLLIAGQSHSLILTPQKISNLTRQLKCDLIITRED